MIEYNLISQILKDDGKIIFTKFPYGLGLIQKEFDVESKIINHTINIKEGNKFLNLFERIDNYKYKSEPIYYIYKKR